MPRRGKRQRLATNIYQDLSGISVLCLGREVRFALGTPLSELRAYHEAYVRRHTASGLLTNTKGTLAWAVDEWDGQETHLASWKERRAELRAWVKALGTVRLSAITAAHIRRAMGRWTTQGIAAKTIRNRLWSLKHLYTIVLGADAPCPVDDVSPPPKVRTVITPVTPQTILSIYAKLLEYERTGRLRDAKTRARFMVRAATGRRPSEIMRAEPSDVDLERRIWRVRDGKGGWSEGLYLNDDMLIAWQTFVGAEAWGAFATDSMAEVLRAAGWPDAKDARGKYLSRPYHLRHAMGTDISESGIDLADVGGWLGHTDIHTTRRIYAPILNSRMTKIAKAMEGRLSGWSVPNGSPKPTSGTLEKHGKSIARPRVVPRRKTAK